jgi:tetratricopeptide (TPR) repeat protein
VIDSSVTQIASTFCERWNLVLDITPPLKLDYSWPSVSTVDKILLPLRSKLQESQELSKTDLLLLRQASAYLCQIVAKTWYTFAGTVSATVEKNGVIIKASGGEHIPQNEEITINIEQELKNILGSTNPQLDSIRGFTASINSETNLIALFTLGICSGLAPGIEGHWSDLSIGQLEEPAQLASKELARTSAENYARIYPEEQYGQVAELYLGGMIFPPPRMNETIPFSQAVSRLINFFEEYQVKSSSIAELVYNLALSPDENMSASGLALFGAVAHQTPPQKIIAKSQSMGSIMGNLRPAMLLVREVLGFPSDWIEEGYCNKESLFRLAIEKEMGFLPWLSISAARLEQAQELPLKNLLLALSTLNLKSSLSAIEEALLELPDDLELHLQKVKLEIISGDAEKAIKTCKSLLSLPQSDSSPKFFNTWGLAQLQISDTQGALRSFRAAAAIIDKDPEITSDVYNNLGWVHLLSSDFNAAEDTLNKALVHATNPTTTLLNLGYLYWKNNKQDLLANTQAKLFDIAPTDPRVFAIHATRIDSSM